MGVCQSQIRLLSLWMGSKLGKKLCQYQQFRISSTPQKRKMRMELKMEKENKIKTAKDSTFPSIISSHFLSNKTYSPTPTNGQIPLIFSSTPNEPFILCFVYFAWITNSWNFARVKSQAYHHTLYYLLVEEMNLFVHFHIIIKNPSVFHATIPFTIFLRM